MEADKVLVAIGRKPYTEGLNLKKMSIKSDNQGRILVNKKFQTSIKNIYAIGDVIKGQMLAHKAEEEGIAVAEIIAGQSGHVNYNINSRDSLYFSRSCFNWKNRTAIN